ncbi:MAG: diguanylate cyclase [Gemmatimonadaceae bacterium]
MRVRQLVLHVVLWVASAVALELVARGAWRPGRLVHAAAALLTLAAAAGVALALRRTRDARWRLPTAGERASRLAVGPLLALVAATGGLRSPALATLALLALWAVRRRRARIALAAAGAVVAAVALLGLHAGTPPTAGDVVAAIALCLAVMVVPRVLTDTAGARLAEERRRADRLGGLLGERDVTPARLSAVTHAGTGPLARVAEGPHTGPGAARAHAGTLARYLRDVRDWAAAEEAVFWRWDPERKAPVAAAWSTVGADAPLHLTGDWAQLVAWSTEERLPHVDRDGGAPRLAICPVEWGVRSLGAVSIASATGMRQSREELLLWLPRFSSHLASLSDLLDGREQVGRQSRHLHALLGATRELPSVQSLDELSRSLFESALTITAGKRAALVRWSAEEGCGAVHSVTPGHVVAPGVPVTERSYVGAVCTGGRPYVWDDASQLDPAGRVYGDGEPRRAIGSLAIVPVFGESTLHGALVVEGDAPRDVRSEDRRSLRHLADLAGRAFDTLAKLQDATRRATTDGLTGLTNRQHFDELFAQELAKVDRFGGTVALVVADVDHFKRVNDSHGHDAGDAVLRAVATTLRERVRDVDLCARFGGEEIVLLLPHTGLAGAVETAERLRRAVEARPIMAGGKEIPVTLSFGVASYPESATRREEFFAVADRALYRAKADGRNCVRSAAPRDFNAKA